MTSSPDQMAKEEEFLKLFAAETGKSPSWVSSRLAQMALETQTKGEYAHTFEELEHGARVAWRNSSKCIGRLVWRTLKLRDCRSARTVEDVYRECIEHIQVSTNQGNIVPTITIFPSRGLRIHNSQLIRYADDPAEQTLRRELEKMGVEFSGESWELLPLLINDDSGTSLIRTLPGEVVLQVRLQHPEFDWFESLNLRWYALPALSDRALEIGGVLYQCCPFSGWYMGTEIGARNLSDTTRFDVLPRIASRMGLDRSSDRTLWRDRALVELNRAVLFSYAQSGVTIIDHHTASKQFMQFMTKEQEENRNVNADWSWIVPPISASATPVFHTPMNEFHSSPRFL